MRTIAVVTVGRADYGCLRPVLQAIQGASGLSLRLLAAGMHLEPAFGMTVKAIEADGFEVVERIPMQLSSDSPDAIAHSIGLGVSGFGRAYARLCPDLLLVLGDRFETHAAVAAAVPFRLPVAHVHGGELTAGAFDDALRHAITKLSHLHFTSTDDAARRVMQMGEEPWRVTVSGAPSLDQLRSIRLLSVAELERIVGLRFTVPPLLVTYHPEMLASEQTEAHVEELVAALRQVDRPIIITLPNADPYGRLIRQRLEQFVGRHPSACVIDNLHPQAYVSVMAVAAAMVGNSSSGLIEAPSLHLPVVNVGARQAGRLRAGNVIDVTPHRDEIIAGIRRAVDPSFRASLHDLVNPYGDGHAAERIVRVLSEVSLGQRLLVKRFDDAPAMAEQP